MIQLSQILFKLILMACFAGMTFGVTAQNGQNPFEIPNRPVEAPSTTVEEEASDNPFDLEQPAATPTLPSETTPPPAPENNTTPNTDTNPFDINQSTPPPSAPTENTNPFDTDTDTDTEASDSPSPPPAMTDNPFEVNRIAIDLNAEREVAPSPVLQPQKIKAPVSTRNFHFGIVLFLIFFLAVLVSLYSSVITQLYKAFLNDNMLKLKHREQGSILNLSLLMLYFYFFLNAGFFGYLIIQYLGWEGDSNAQLLLFCVLGVMAAFFSKHLVLRILGAVFPVEKEIKQYNFTIVVFNIILGLTLLPFNLLIAYGPTGFPKYLIYSTLAIIALVYGFRIIRSLLIGSRYISLHKFHFFMYLCTVEIAPTLVLVKLLLFT